MERYPSEVTVKPTPTLFIVVLCLMIYVIVAELENCVGGNLRPVRHRAVSPHQEQVQPGVAAPHHSNWLKDYQKQLKAER